MRQITSKASIEFSEIDGESECKGFLNLPIHLSREPVLNKACEGQQVNTVAACSVNVNAVPKFQYRGMPRVIESWERTYTECKDSTSSSVQN